jgi:energy-converting hydrogenase Eha subunit B
VLLFDPSSDFVLLSFSLFLKSISRKKTKIVVVVVVGSIVIILYTALILRLVGLSTRPEVRGRKNRGREGKGREGKGREEKRRGGE